MYCPQCAQPQPAEPLQFCSQCGFPTEGVQQLVAAGGRLELLTLPTPATELAPRPRGVRQGVKLMLLSLALVPAYFLLAALFPAHDQLVEAHVSDTPFEKIAQALLVTLFLLGLARVVYAYLFARAATSAKEGATETGQLKAAAQYALPPAQSIPVNGFGTWRAQTGEMSEPQRTTEQTTRSLSEE